MMDRIADFLFEAKMLKELPRAGYAFLGAGRENVAEHSFMTAMIAFSMSRMEPDIDTEKLLAMALVHDLAEARTGDLNYVNKRYVTAHEGDAVADLTRGLVFGHEIEALIEEFNQAITREALLARDADQLSFVMELKQLRDIGARGPGTWLSYVLERIKTDTGRQMAESLMGCKWDRWWLKDYTE